MKIVTHQLSKRFNRDWVFQNFSFEFTTGKSYALIGPNGSGKSTLLQILWGQMPPSEGSITYTNDAGIVEHSEIYKSMAIATPYMDLIEEFTLEEMVRFHFKFKQPRDSKSYSEIIEAIGLDHAKKKLISQFSSGMRQRLKLGLAFKTEAQALFLDEPTTNLDKKAIDWYWQNLTPLLHSSLTIIASNQEAEYPESAEKIGVLDFKKGYNHK